MRYDADRMAPLYIRIRSVLDANIDPAYSNVLEVNVQIYRISGCYYTTLNTIEGWWSGFDIDNQTVAGEMEFNRNSLQWTLPVNLSAATTVSITISGQGSLYNRETTDMGPPLRRAWPSAMRATVSSSEKAAPAIVRSARVHDTMKFTISAPGA